jgi:hypothetical protein
VSPVRDRVRRAVFAFLSGMGTFLFLTRILLNDEPLGLNNVGVLFFALFFFWRSIDEV